MSDEDKAVVGRFLETFSAGDVDGVLALLHDDCDWWVSGSLDGFSGSHTKAEMAQLLGGVADAYADGALHVTPTAMIAEGGRVVVEADARGELTAGGVYAPQSAWIFDVAADGRITQIKEYLDTQHAHATFFAG